MRSRAVFHDYQDNPGSTVKIPDMQHLAGTLAFSKHVCYCETALIKPDTKGKDEMGSSVLQLLLILFHTDQIRQGSG